MLYQISINLLGIFKSASRFPFIHPIAVTFHPRKVVLKNCLQSFALHDTSLKGWDNKTPEKQMPKNEFTLSFYFKSKVLK
jgi:hypothetical protein